MHGRSAGTPTPLTPCRAVLKSIMRAVGMPFGMDRGAEDAGLPLGEES
jgi:hypothetical protein